MNSYVQTTTIAGSVRHEQRSESSGPAPELPWSDSEHPVVAGLVWFIEGITLVALSLLMLVFLDDSIKARELAVASLGATLVFLSRSRRRGLYSMASLLDYGRNARAFLLQLLISAGGMVFILCLLGWPTERIATTSFSWLLAAMTLLSIERLVFQRVIEHASVAVRLVRRVAIIGNAPSAIRIEDRLATGPGITLVGRFDDPLSDGRKDLDSVRDIETLVSLSRQHPLDAIILALPYERRSEVAALCLRLRTVRTDIYVAPYLLDGYDTVLPEARVGPFRFSVAQRRPLDEWQSFEKLMFDRTIGGILLICVLPALLVLALLIRWDSPGPAIFRQTRLGLNNRPFTLFKFRTMHAAQADLLADRQTSRGDPRVTRLGRWLRRLSLDELPQLFNVVAGDMSLVGPRPHAPNTRAGGKLLGDALAEYVIRHQIKPGLTGWAQVNGARGELATIEQLQKRVALDLEYMRRWSLLFDLRIIMLTVTREIFSRHAY